VSIDAQAKACALRTRRPWASGLEPHVIAEAHLDAASIFGGIERFAGDRESRIARQRDSIAKL
jgi:hypothetical protein